MPIQLAQKDCEARWAKKNNEVQGYADAQSDLGTAYAAGDGVKKNKVEAINWWRKAAEQGDATAQTNLGRAYDQGGGGVKKDMVESLNWYRKAAEQGDAEGQYARKEQGRKPVRGQRLQKRGAGAETRGDGNKKLHT